MKEAGEVELKGGDWLMDRADKMQKAAMAYHEFYQLTNSLKEAEESARRILESVEEIKSRFTDCRALLEM